MVEVFAVYALLLAAWGVWAAWGEGAVPEPAPLAPPEVEPAIERGDAARRMLNTLP